MELLRLLNGELDIDRAANLQRRIGREPELAKAMEDLVATWSGLEPPPATALPAGSNERVMARTLEAVHGTGESFAPVWWPTAGWARWVSVGALVAGVGVGVLVVPPVSADDEWSEALVRQSSLADSYWLLVDEEDSAEVGGDSWDAAEPARELGP